MRPLSPKILLIIIALGLALVISLGLVVWMRLDSNDIPWKWVISSFIIFFIISSLTSALLLFFVNILVFKRVEQLLSTVKNFRSQSDKISVNTYSKDDIDNLDMEILAWADDRKNEIERLKNLELYRKEFLGNVSHELKTPVFNIQGYVLTLLDGGLEDPSINRNYLVRAEKSVDRMISIIDDLEAISQLETGELQIEPERFDLVALARDVVDAQELKATAKGIILTIAEESRPVFVLADKFRIRQVFVNLIVNSVKYGKEYGETQIRFYETGDLVSVEIVDNGIGIDQEHLPRLFERFYRVDKSRSRDAGGTGLGLSIVKHIIEAHHQNIKVSSTKDVGTVFSFTLKKG